VLSIQRWRDAPVLAGDGAEGGHILHRRLESMGDTARKSYSGFKRWPICSTGSMPRSPKGSGNHRRRPARVGLSIRNLMFTLRIW